MVLTNLKQLKSYKENCYTTSGQSYSAPRCSYSMDLGYCNSQCIPQKPFKNCSTMLLFRLMLSHSTQLSLTWWPTKTSKASEQREDSLVLLMGEERVRCRKTTKANLLLVLQRQVMQQCPVTNQGDNVFPMNHYGIEVYHTMGYRAMQTTLGQPWSLQELTHGSINFLFSLLELPCSPSTNSLFSPAHERIQHKEKASRGSFSIHMFTTREPLIITLSEGSEGKASRI